MKILFATSWFPSKFFPTNGNFVERHARAFMAMGHEVIIVHEEYSNRVLVPRLEYRVHEGLSVFQIFLPRTLKSSVRLRKGVIDKMLKKYSDSFQNINLVHGHVFTPVGTIAQYLAEKLNVPLFFTEHWSGFLPERPIDISSSELARIKTVAKNCHAIMPVSTVLKNAMESLGIQGNYQVVFNTVDTSIYKLDRAQKRSKFTFLHVSSFAKGIKNVDGIMRAFDKMKSQLPGSDAQLLIAGDGDVQEVEQTRSKSNSKADIQILGTQTFEEVAHLMQSAHCFVLFSEFETFGLVAAEAQCCGLPVILSDVGALPERMTSEEGIFVKPGDEAALTEAMVEMISKYHRYSELEIQDRAHKAYSYEAVVSEYIELYKC